MVRNATERIYPIAAHLRLTAQRKPALAVFFRERRLHPTIFRRSMRRRFSSTVEFTHHRQYLALLGSTSILPVSKPGSPTIRAFRFGPYWVASALASITADLRAAAS